MANERDWDAVGPLLLTANGTTAGVLQVADTAGLFVGMQVTLLNNLPLQQTVYIKRVVDNTTIWVGAKKGGMDHNVDVSAFTIATASTVTADMQPKSTVPMEARLLATYETDPLNDWRVRPIDPYGNGYTASNPFPVSVDGGSISIGEVGIVGPAPEKNQLNVNADGSINVIVESVPSPNSTIVNTYNELVAVASGLTVTIVTYTVPPATQAIFQKASFSGENIARYDLFINGAVQDTARTMFGGDLTGEFNFTTGNDSGLIVPAGQIIKVQVYNVRPTAASFEARIQVLEVPA